VTTITIHGAFECTEISSLADAECEDKAGHPFDPPVSDRYRRFTFMEDDFFGLVSNYSQPKTSLYGLLDALKILLLRPVDFAIFTGIERKASFLTVEEPTLASEFERIVKNHALDSEMDCHRVPIGGGVSLLLYKYNFDMSAFSLIRNSEHEYYILSDFFNSMRKRITGPLIDGYIRKLTSKELGGATFGARRAWRQQTSKAKQVSYPAYRDDRLNILREHIGSIIDNIYTDVATTSPLLTMGHMAGDTNNNSDGSEKHIDTGQKFAFPNLFFVLVEPLLHINKRRSFGDSGYSYTLRLFFPKAQQQDIKEYLIRTGKFSAKDADNLLIDAQLPMADERSVLDRSASSGVLGFSFFERYDNHHYTMCPNGRTSNEENETAYIKHRRNTATHKLFNELFDVSATKQLFMQEFVVHVGGAPYILACTLTSMDKGLTEENLNSILFIDHAFPYWVYHYGFYAHIMRHRISKRLKRDIKSRYFHLLGHLVSQAMASIYKAKVDGDVCEAVFSGINHTLSHLYVVFPFSVVSFYREKPLLDGGASLFTVDIRGHDRWNFFFTMEMNLLFLRNIPFYHFNYERDVIRLIEKAAEATWGEVKCHAIKQSSRKR
jgi:hypothetical protein